MINYTDKDAQAELLAFQKETILPKTYLPENFIELWNKIVKKMSAYTMRISNEDFKSLLQVTDNNYSLFQVASIANVCIVQTMASLELEQEQYFAFMEAIDKMVTYHREVIEPKQKALQNKLQALNNAGGQKPEKGKTMSLPTANA